MFNTDTLLIIIALTIIIFSWIFFTRDRLAKYFVGFFVLTFLVYAGIGGALNGVNPSYRYYYFIFSICVSLGLFWSFKIIKASRNRNKYLSWYIFFDNFCDKYATRIICLYLGLNLLNLIIPEFKLNNLIQPPAPDLVSAFGERYKGGDSNVAITILDGINSFLYPFFLFSLFKYRKDTLRLSAIIFLSYYIDYCATAYLGRGAMMTGLIIVGAFTYFNRPKLGKIIIISAVFIIPTLLTFLVQYSVTRIGGTATAISASEAFETLLAQEGSYPMYFNKILRMPNDYVFNYLYWLFTMPLPGVVRGGLDVNFNAAFSEYLLGIQRGDYGFYILLPGIVGESVFLMGKYFYWINGIVLGFLMGACFRILSRYPQTFGLLVAAGICFGYTICRGGLSSGIPLILKVFVYFYLVMWFLKKRKHRMA